MITIVYRLIVSYGLDLRWLRFCKVRQAIRKNRGLYGHGSPFAARFND